MNILQILPELNVGGVETGTRDFAKYLVKAGHKSVVVSAGGDLVPEIQRQGSIHYTLAVQHKSLIAIMRAIPKLTEIIRKEKIDIVHARSRVPAWIAFFATRFSSAAFITTCHGYYKTHFASRPMSWGKLVICPSQVIANHMDKDFGLPVERIRLVPRGVDLEKFRFVLPSKKQSGVFNIGIIGRLSPLKGHAHFLRSVARVMRRTYKPAIKIWIVGDASSSHQAYKKELQVLVKRLGLNHCTEFLGTQQDVAGVLADLNLVVLSSVCHEAFGRVIIEAQAAGVPVIATRVGGVVDIIDDNETGVLVAPGDVGALAKEITRIIKDNSLAVALAEKGYKKVQEKFSLELMSTRTLAVYEEALSRHKILVIKLSSLGDVILAAPSLRALRKKFPSPNYKISLLVNSPYQEALFNCSDIDELIVCDLNDKGLRIFFELAQELRKKNFDFLIDLQNNYKSHILSFLSLVPARYGYNRKFGFMLNHAIMHKQMDRGPVEHQFRILKMLNVETKDQRLELLTSKKDETYIKNFLNEQWVSSKQVLVGISLSASAKWQSKNWPIDYIASVCEDFSLRDIRVIFTGEANDLPRATSIVSLLQSSKPIIACGKTNINQLVCLIKKCQCFISSDSAPLHIAAAVDTPYVALFGPTDPNRHLVSGHKGVVLCERLECSHCYKPRCKRKLDCMHAIKPKSVIEAVQSLL